MTHPRLPDRRRDSERTANPVPYRLDELAALAAELGLLAERVGPDRVDVVLFDGCRLAFCNLSEDADTLVGFDGTPWHSHGVVSFLAGSPNYVECDELELLIGLGVGELVVVSLYVGGMLKDRWIEHKNEPLELRYIEPSEELRVFRLPVQGAPISRSTHVAG
ncbi:MAG: hypothetical protein IT373_17570 [Polyangiaceae bacterium]|nr:hypothetical protein [Polyangiaceae bacterium]